MSFKNDDSIEYERLERALRAGSVDEVAEVLYPLVDANIGPGPVIRRLQPIVEDERDYRTLFRSLRPLLDEDDEILRNTAIQLAATLAEDRPEEASTLVPVLLDRLDDEYEIARWNAVRAISPLAAQHPSTVAKKTKSLLLLLDSSSSEIRKRTLGVLADIAVGDVPGTPAVVSKLLDVLDPRDEDNGPELGPVLGSNEVDHHRQVGLQNLDFSGGRGDVRRAASVAVAAYAEHHPEPVRETIATRTRIVTEEDSPLVLDPFLDALFSLVDTGYEPETVEDLAPVVVKIILHRERGPELRGKAARVLTSLAADHQSTVVDAVVDDLPAIVNSVDTDSPHLRCDMLGLLTHVAELSPDELAATDIHLRSRLDDPEASVRESTALILGCVGDPADVSLLRKVAETDSHRDVRSAAGEASERLERGE